MTEIKTFFYFVILEVDNSQFEINSSIAIKFIIYCSFSKQRTCACSLGNSYRKYNCCDITLLFIEL